MRVYTAPEIPSIRRNDSTIFLAGSIEMGAARNWQEEFIETLKPLDNNWVVLNPRRKEWDSSWEQSISNPQFFQQVDWELTWLERAQYDIFYFQKDTKSPITLLELGAFGNQYNSFVVCEEGFWRKGNVDIFCNRRGIPMYHNLVQVASEIRGIKNH